MGFDFCVARRVPLEAGRRRERDEAVENELAGLHLADGGPRVALADGLPRRVLGAHDVVGDDPLAEGEPALPVADHGEPVLLENLTDAEVLIFS